MVPPECLLERDGGHHLPVPRQPGQYRHRLTVGGDLVTPRRLVQQPAQVDRPLLVPAELVESCGLLVGERDLDVVFCGRSSVTQSQF